MAHNSPILFIDEDPDDHDVARQAFAELQISNRVDCVRSGEEAYEYLIAQPPPFLIFCDYILPRMDGMELRKRIEDNEELRSKAIPFVYFSTTVSKQMGDEVYKMNVQGLFEKGDRYNEIRDLLKQIFDYWQKCKHPNNQRG